MNALAMPCTRCSCSLARVVPWARRIPAGRAGHGHQDGQPERPADLPGGVHHAGGGARILRPDPASAAVVSGTIASPIPAPNKIIGPSTPGRYGVPGVIRESHTIPAITGTIPATASGIAGNRRSRQDATTRRLTSVAPGRARLLDCTHRYEYP